MASLRFDAALAQVTAASNDAVERCRQATRMTAVCAQAWENAVSSARHAAARANELLAIASDQLDRFSASSSEGGAAAAAERGWATIGGPPLTPTGNDPTESDPTENDPTENDPTGDSPTGDDLPLAEAEKDRVATIELRVLGPFSIEIDATAVELDRLRHAKSLAVLQRLAVTHGTPVRRDVLIEAIWPEIHPDEGRRRLHQAVYALRHGLRELIGTLLVIEFANGAYHLRANGQLRVDLDEFERTGPHDDPDRAAYHQERCYRGELLAGAEEEWIEVERDRLRRRYVTIAARAASWLSDQGRHAESVEVWERVQRCDPWNEAAIRGIMHGVCRLGQPSLARRAFTAFAERLDHDLGVRPDPETERVHHALLEIVHQQ